MGAPAKFLFDTDFAATKPAQRAPTLAEVAAEVAEAEARGYRNGFAAGQNEATVETGRRHAAALGDIARAVEAIARQLSEAERRMELEAVEVAIAVARKLSGELMAAEPLSETMAMVADCFRHLTSVPHIAVRINDGLYETARHDIERLAKQSGFEGRLVILAEPEIPSGDCRIEWADGGVVLDRAATEAKINELVGRYMASRKPGAPS